jgi:hypothetical protein
LTWDEEEDGLKEDQCLGPDPDTQEAAAMTFFESISQAILLNGVADEPSRLHNPATHLHPATPAVVDALDGVWKGQIMFPDKVPCISPV